MGGAGSQLLMNHRRAVFGCGLGVAELQYPTVRTRLCMCQLGKDKVFARTRGKVNLGGGLNRGAWRTPLFHAVPPCA